MRIVTLFALVFLAAAAAGAQPPDAAAVESASARFDATATGATAAERIEQELAELKETLEGVRTRVAAVPDAACAITVPWHALLDHVANGFGRLTSDGDAGFEKRGSAMLLVQHVDRYVTYVTLLSGQMCRRRANIGEAKEKAERERQQVLSSLRSVADGILSARAGCARTTDDSPAMTSLFHAHRPDGERPRELFLAARPHFLTAVRRSRALDGPGPLCDGPQALSGIAEHAVDSVAFLPNWVEEREDDYAATRRLLQQRVDGDVDALFRTRVQ